MCGTLGIIKMQSTPKSVGLGAPGLALALALVLMAVCQLANSQQQQQPQPSLRFARQQASSSSSSSLKPRLKANAPAATAGALRERSVVANATSSGRLETSAFVEDELPPDFYEMPPEQLDLGMNATGRAPTPELNVAVLQNGERIDSAITVHPGTPLEMLIYLDDKSAEVYGLLTSHLKVQDTDKRREEVIIANGCSIDTYIFGNFEQNQEDKGLRAKFRAFKFPDSNFVRFTGTVNVCIKQCAKVNCNGASGNGVSRRKRGAAAANNNSALQLTVSTVLRIGNANANVIN